MARDVNGPVTEDEFVTAVVQAARIGSDLAERAIQATLQTLADRTDAGKARDLAAALPDTIPQTWARRPRPSGSASTNSCVGWRRGRAWTSRRRFVTPGRVRAATDADEGRRATDAVLETLAMRIAGGEVDDLRARLPIEFHPALEHGRRACRSTGRSSTCPRCCAPSAKWWGEQEFLDVISQLPAEYEALVRR